MRVQMCLCFLFLSACAGSSTALSGTPTEETSLPGVYEYQVGLGYGFLDKEVVVLIDGDEILSVTGTEEIEQFAQLLGTKILVSGSAPENEVLVTVIVDGGEPFEQDIDLNEGRYIHIYLEETGLKIFNTEHLIYE